MLSPRKILLPFAAAVVLGAFGAATVGPAHAATAQQQKMKTCNAGATAKSLSGADRRSYMKSCLSKGGGGMSTSHNSQREKMRTCNAQAKSKALKGVDRKHFMSSCLKGS